MFCRKRIPLRSSCLETLRLVLKLTSRIVTTKCRLPCMKCTSYRRYAALWSFSADLKMNCFSWLSTPPFILYSAIEQAWISSWRIWPFALTYRLCAWRLPLVLPAVRSFSAFRCDRGLMNMTPPALDFYVELPQRTNCTLRRQHPSRLFNNRTRSFKFIGIRCPKAHLNLQLESTVGSLLSPGYRVNYELNCLLYVDSSKCLSYCYWIVSNNFSTPRVLLWVW